VATVSSPEPRLLSVQVWDKSNVTPVEKAIRNAGLGINPITDGQNIRLPIPDLTEERRKELVKLAHSYAEKAKIAVRNVRRDGNDDLKTDEKKKEISEDDRKRAETEVQKMTDATIAEIDAALSAKEKEILGK
jgi:ribosome recycling factor